MVLNIDRSSLYYLLPDELALEYNPDAIAKGTVCASE